MKETIKFLALAVVASLALPELALAEDPASVAGTASGIIAIGVGAAIGLAGLGGTLGQGRAVATALEAIGRNPAAGGKLFVPMLIGLAFVESLVILAFVVSLQLAGKV